MKREDLEWSRGIADKIVSKLAWVSEKSKHKIPFTTKDGIHDNKADDAVVWDRDNGINWWTNGFWGGMMWLMYLETKDHRYAEIARFSEEKLDRCFEDFYGLHHDVGFMWLPTAVADYRITGNQDARRRGLHAANLLAGRFNPIGKFIRAWNDIPGSDDDTRGWAIIDCMFNIPLLYWAASETGDPKFRHIAMQHADTVMENFIRPDGSSEHIVEFDPEKGGKVRGRGGQGYGEGSSWSRGQTWALYGFVMSYIHTGKQEYLDTAKRAAHYFIANIPESGLIPIDFRQPEKPSWEDSTASAIAASGLIELAAYVPEYEKGMYLNAAIKLLKVLAEKRCCWGMESDCILEKCSGSYHEKNHEYSIIYGDYYFMEAIFKLTGNKVFFW